MKLIPSVFLFLTAPACVQTLPPPVMPAREIPSMPPVDAHIPEGHGRLLIDANGEQAQVFEIEARGSWSGYSGSHYAVGYSVITRPLCQTPCYADLTYGTRELRILGIEDPTRGDDIVVQVSSTPQVVRHHMGKHGGSGGLFMGGLILNSFAITGMLVGGILLPVGLADDSHGLTEAGAWTLGLSTVGLGAAIAMMLADRPVEQSGTTAIFPMQERH